ncbi:type II secretion system F family protein [Defluviitalea raffinosedens]|uniref:Type II secretion system F family protein n=1 Tax=Defluviitalea raffinosedens TaxID=1450156 RepID=A0A7C8HIF2_9FIRM|nr:type II secretion system F family protein [Defluviitalea raffinosedens]KAE9637254.1 type II secretion system F family protein [Defluviitalea raffinosedens]MBM7685556.1 type IV pilus assembly protein PilC [Defluviitalea raffinosedens]MBZ4669277.1 type secretory pathway, component PulF [Defluviitaleaceae bacterium]HHW66715.1 type II secretion system F family protein [Candidatus Epulonipiscium sp.]
MPVYTYKAKDINGTVIKGEIEFDSKEETIHHLLSRNLIPMDIKGKNIWNTDLSQLSMFRPKVKIEDIAVFCRQFAVMLQSGISIGGTLDTLGKQCNNASFRGIIQKIHEEVQKGRGLSEAMREHKAFPLILINMVEAGEISGNLDSVMDQMAIHFEKVMKIQRQIKKAMTYPILLINLMVVVVISMLVFVVPRFVGMFYEIDAELPKITLALLTISDFMQEKWFIIFAIFILLIFGFKYIEKSVEVKYWLDWCSLKVPLFGNLNKKIIYTHFSRTLCSLMAAGIPIIQTMEVLEKVVQNTVAMKVIDQCKNEIKQGGSLATAMQQSDFFPVMLISMVRIGEESGSLETVMAKTAHFYEEELETVIDQMTSLISPLITLIMGGILTFIMLAIIMPMFTLATQI